MNTKKKATKKTTKTTAKKASVKTPTKKVVKKVVKKSAVVDQKITPVVLPNICASDFQGILEGMGACSGVKHRLRESSVRDIYNMKDLHFFNWFFTRVSLGMGLTKIQQYAFGGPKYAKKFNEASLKAHDESMKKDKNFFRAEQARVRVYLKYYNVEKEANAR